MLCEWLIFLQRFPNQLDSAWYDISYKQPSLPPRNMRPFSVPKTTLIETLSVLKINIGLLINCISSNVAVFCIFRIGDEIVLVVSPNVTPSGRVFKFDYSKMVASPNKQMLTIMHFIWNLNIIPTFISCGLILPHIV